MYVPVNMLLYIFCPQKSMFNIELLYCHESKKKNKQEKNWGLCNIRDKSNFKWKKSAEEHKH